MTNEKKVRSEKVINYIDTQRKLSYEMIDDIKKFLNDNQTYIISELRKITDMHFEVATLSSILAEHDARDQAAKALNIYLVDLFGIEDDMLDHHVDEFLNYYDNER